MRPATPPSTIVPADDRIFAPAGHGTIWLVLGVGALLAAAAVAWWSLRRPRAATAVAEPEIGVSARYVSRLDELELLVESGAVDARAASHALSRTMREFAGDTGTPGAAAMSCAQLAGAGRHGVAELIRSLERSQFDVGFDRPATPAIQLARRLIAESTPGEVGAPRGPS